VRILVVGSSGAVGRHVVAQASGHGHDVTALDRPDAQEAAAAVVGRDAVISTLVVDGATAGAAADLTAEVVRAMTARGVDRLVVASVAGAGGHLGATPLRYRAYRLFSGAGAGAEADGVEAVEGDVMLSDLAWSIVRAPVLTNRAQTGHYRIVEGPVVPRGLTIGRADLAAILLKVAETGRYPRRVVAAAY
jgi:putative NADH-flavin reductase